MYLRRPYGETDSWFDTMQVCEQGHKITGMAQAHPEDCRERCPDCGSATLSACPSGKAPIFGYKHIASVIYRDASVPPAHCSNCAGAFPWTALSCKRGKANPESPIGRVETILTKFHVVARQLRDRHSRRQTLEVDDEYDVQDLLHALLKIDFDDIRAEEWTPSYAGSAARMDFLIKPAQIVIETKKTAKGHGAKEIGEELLIDVQKYKEHPACKILICFVYDPGGIIGNPAGLKADLERSSCDELVVQVHISPT
ncbi:MAG: DUF2321 domain-containing protein [Planctomycetes bacterium]|nr:DUF2321 domain-containing protein [Planctomycetota bacterium]